MKNLPKLGLHTWPFAILAILAISVLGIWLFGLESKQVPAVVISSVALGFSYYAYRFSRERFRLDLLDRRWEIYEQVLKFCSVVVTHGGLPRKGNDDWVNQSVIKGLKAAHESLRGIGLHKAKSLFGPEIHEKLKRMNELYAWFVAQPRNEGWVETESQNLKEIIDTIDELPTLFKPYVYFGDYKN